MIFKKLEFYSLLLLLLYSIFCYSNESKSFSFQRAIYLGVLGGYGSTTWEGLVPTKENQNSALNLSTPIRVREGGGVWGVLAGYEFISAFALEASYMHFPKADVFFDPDSLFSFNNNDLVTLSTNTDSLNLMAKIMLPISTTSFRIYSSVGIASVHRTDILTSDWRLSPTFGAGINYRVSNHVMAEIAGNYTAGYGESQLSPTDTYFPFLYSVTARLSYRF
ncbi:outer membrane beta-barrel protein [Legionella sp.]|uniref:outer membrane protein n=1 Tax=Legionella sp. TaxID=459 RepID=UPI00321F9889